MKKRVDYHREKIMIFTFFTALALVLTSVFTITDQSNSAQSDLLNYHGNVCVYKNGQLIECSHNLLYSNGKNLTRDILGGGANMGAILNISLCNGSGTTGCGTPVAAATEGFNLYNNCGLSATNGAYTANTVGDGNWSVAKTFTASCDSLLVNATRLSNATGSVFAGNTFTLVTLQTNDQLTINWTLTVS